MKSESGHVLFVAQIVQKFRLVVSHVEKHKQEQEKPNSLLDAIYQDWKRENK